MPTTYYSDYVLGSDGNSGATGSPKRSIAAGLALLSAGDALEIRSANSSEVIASGAIPSGVSDGVRTIVRAATGKTIVIAGLDIFSRSFITMQDIIAVGHTNRIGRNSTSDPLSTYITFIRMTAKNWTGGGSGGGGFMPGFRQEGESCYMLLQSCNAFGNGSTKLDHGCYVSGRNITIDGGNYHDNFGHGIQIFHSGSDWTDDCIVRNLRAYGNGSFGVGAYSGRRIKVYNNLIYLNGARLAGSGGLKLGYNAHDAQLLNNVMYKNTGYGAQIDSSITNATFRNNITRLNTLTDFNDLGSATIKDHNLPPGTDPLFVDPANGDFRLRVGSPAIGAGVDLSVVFTTDFLGNTR